MTTVIHGSYTIQWEFSQRSDRDMRKEENIRQFLKKHGLDEDSFIIGKQVHGTSVKLVDSSVCGKKIENVDGFVAGVSNDESMLTLGVKSADCVPILFYDKTRGIIGAAHSGWKGTYGNIAQEVVQQMKSVGAQVDNICVIVGPHIRPCCYSVPPDRANLFIQKYGKESVHLENNTYYLHLEDIIVSQLLAQGIYVNHIQRSDQCTSTLSEKYFSYRKDSHESFGEQIAIMSIKRYNPS